MSKRKYVLLNTNCSLKDSSRNVCFELEAISLILSIAVVDYHHLMCKIQNIVNVCCHSSITISVNSILFEYSRARREGFFHVITSDVTDRIF